MNEIIQVENLTKSASTASRAGKLAWISLNIVIWLISSM
jgi:hypothetical protein